MTGYDKLNALLQTASVGGGGPSNKNCAANDAAPVGGDGRRNKDSRPDLYDAFAEPSECVEEMNPGAAILALVFFWLVEHWPALAIGAAAGLMAIAIPAMIIAPALAR